MKKTLNDDVRALLKKWSPKRFKNITFVETSITCMEEIISTVREITKDGCHVEYLRDITNIILNTFDLPPKALEDITELLYMGDKFNKML